MMCTKVCNFWQCVLKSKNEFAWLARHAILKWEVINWVKKQKSPALTKKQVDLLFDGMYLNWRSKGVEALPLALRHKTNISFSSQIFVVINSKDISLPNATFQSCNFDHRCFLTIYKRSCGIFFFSKISVSIPLIADVSVLLSLPPPHIPLTSPFWLCKGKKTLEGCRNGFMTLDLNNNLGRFKPFLLAWLLAISSVNKIMKKDTNTIHQCIVGNILWTTSRQKKN